MLPLSSLSAKAPLDTKTSVQDIEEAHKAIQTIVIYQELLISLQSTLNRLLFTVQDITMTIEARLAFYQWITTMQIAINTVQMLLHEATVKASRQPIPTPPPPMPKKN